VLLIDNDNKHMSVHYTTFAKEIIRSAEILTGMMIRDFQLQLSSNSIIEQILIAGKTYRFNRLADLLAETLPKFFRPLAGQLERILKVKEGIIVPLRVNEKTMGVFIIFGSGLSKEVIPAVEIFTAQMGISLQNAQLTQQLKSSLDYQQELAHTDALTGIYNRRYLYQLAGREFDIAMRYQHPLSVIMFDIDHFKNINDTFGHMAGDHILQQVTGIARAELRSADVIGRYGGEEFVIILPMTNAKQAYSLAERIRKKVEALRIQPDKADASVTLSIGISEIYHAAQNKSVDHLIRSADEAMYDAKHAGRNCTRIKKAWIS
jgi:diguanylate cyclase (GGDEF)-like protein